MSYSYIDMELDGGLGDVVEKNVKIDSNSYISSYLTSIHHANGEDWWVINPDSGKNIFHTFLISESGITSMESQLMSNIPISERASARGEAKFSPDGKMYCYFNRYDGLFLYDFDRFTGLLSNARHIDVIVPLESIIASCEFSPDSRYLYWVESAFVYQLDTWADDLEDSMLLIGENNFNPDPFPSSFFSTTLGPDCKIYIRGGSSALSFHVIHKPNERGAACDFVQQGITLPFFSSTGSFPNFPRFRVDEEEKCDPSISTFVGETVYWRRDMTVFPNPAIDRITIDLPEAYARGEVYVVDMKGQIVMTQDIGPAQTGSGLQTSMILDVGVLPVGSYSVEFVPEDNAERVVYTSVFVKIE